jgi:hypothetical protein
MTPPEEHYTGTIISRTDTMINIDGLNYTVPANVKPYVDSKKDGRLVEIIYIVNENTGIRSLKKIMPANGGGKSPIKTAAKNPDLTTREGVLISLDGANLVTVHTGGMEKHYAINPALMKEIKDTVNLPQNCMYAFDKVKIIQDVKLREHLENYTFVPASDLGTKKDKKLPAEPPLFTEEEMGTIKAAEKEIEKVQKDPTLTDAEKETIRKQKAADAAKILRTPETAQKMQENGFVTGAEMMNGSVDRWAALDELLKDGRSITVSIGGSTQREQYETRKAEISGVLLRRSDLEALEKTLYLLIEETHQTILAWKYGGAPRV